MGLDSLPPRFPYFLIWEQSGTFAVTWSNPSFYQKGNRGAQYLLKAKLWSRVVVEGCL